MNAKLLKLSQSVSELSPVKPRRRSVTPAAIQICVFVGGPIIAPGFRNYSCAGGRVVGCGRQAATSASKTIRKVRMTISFPETDLRKQRTARRAARPWHPALQNT